MTRQLKIVFLFIALMFFGCASDEVAKEPFVIDPSRGSFIRTFEAHSGHMWTLKTNLAGLLESKETENYFKSSLVCSHKNNECFQAELKVSSRGNTRKRHCDFPPLKFNFKKMALYDKGLNRFDHYKLVTHCKEDEMSENVLLREYLVYKLYQALTPNSLNAVEIKIRYEDNENKIPAIEKHAFLIEPIEELCLREEVNHLDDPNLKLKSIHAEQYKLFTLFQYMIGNTDWNLSKRHNLKLVQKKDESPIPIPYDFDYSGFVNAPYARPHPQLPIKNIRERLFQYRGGDRDFTNVIQLFKDKKQALFNICNQFEYLDEANRKDMVNYLTSFYKIIEDPALLQEKLVDKK